MYIRVVDGKPVIYSIGQLRKDYPNVSFPKQVPDSILKEYKIYRVIVHEEPEYNAEAYIAEKDLEPTLTVDGWGFNWTIRPLTEEEIAARQFQKASSIRSQRDALLSNTDWIVVKALEAGEEVPADLKSYRQALRDVPSQETFPDSVTWPESSYNNLNNYLVVN